MDEESLVEAAMFDAPRLALDVAVLDVNLRGLREARELLVRRLGGDDARRVGAEILVRPMAKWLAKIGWNFMKPAQASSNRM